MNYEIIENIATINRSGGKTLELNRIKWFDRPESYDLRLWDGETPLKGVSMSEEEWIELCHTFEEYEDNDEEHEGDGEIYYQPDEEEIDYRDFFIHTNTPYCSHKCRPIIAAVHQYSRGKVKMISFDANYCPICSLYYITESTYRRITQDGRILCQLLSIDEYLDYKRRKEYGDLQPQGILKMIGYTVNARDDLSEDARHTVLQYAIDEGVLEKKRVVSYLEYFIRLNRNVENNKKAVEKWADDLDWIRRYSNNGKIIVGVKRFIKDD